MDTLTASAHLRRLRDLELLEQKGKGSATYYILTQKLLLSVSTPHITSLSEGLTPHITQLSEGLSDQIAAYGELNEELRDAIQQIKGRTPPDAIKDLIKRLCVVRPNKPSELALLLKRSQRYIRDYYLTPMIDKGELELLFPNNPAHPQQAYKTKSLESDEG